MLIAMFNIIGPILIITGIGFILGRSSVELQSRTLSSLVILVATPALIFNTLTSMHVNGDTIKGMALAALVCIGVAGGIGLIALYLLKAPIRSFLPSLMLPNSGNMGLPLAILAFGPEGARLGVSYFLVVALFQYSAGLTISSGSWRIWELCKQPLLYSVFLVIAVLVFDLTVPEVVLKTTEMLGGMMIPAMLILLGISLASLKMGDLRPACAMAAGRLLIGIISALIVIALLDLEGTPAGVVFLLATMPSAIVTYVFAERYGQNAQQVAGAVLMSTLLTLVCLPALVYAALKISGHSIVGG